MIKNVTLRQGRNYS